MVSDLCGYALSNGIISTGYDDYNAEATRADYAMIFASAFPKTALPAINTIEDNAIPDVAPTAAYGSAVYLLYRAGVLTGSPGSHAFLPDDYIKRSEVSAVVARMADSGSRVSFNLTYYTGYYPIPDLGAFFGTEPYDTEYNPIYDSTFTSMTRPSCLRMCWTHIFIYFIKTDFYMILPLRTTTIMRCIYTLTVSSICLRISAIRTLVIR